MVLENKQQQDYEYVHVPRYQEMDHSVCSLWNSRVVFVFSFLWRPEDFSATLAIVTVYFLRMSGAKCGYVDPSSTDKDAADATDEVELEVLCMAGEGVTLK